MITLLALLIIVSIAFYLSSYGFWSLRNGYRMGAAGVFIIAVTAFLLPVFVWIYHNI
ncbi:MAG: hypothetical protein K9L17_05645 [Clostridiales bacterium]|nr:hypothetical protein [Clostridiales bacterium]MCF8022155.1 hypothetical protein [Clostridiales bacterium]